MRIFVQTMQGCKIPLEVESFDTIDYVKDLIRAKEGTRLSDQTLIWDGRRLEDSRTIADYNIQNDDTVDLMYPQCPGYHVYIKTFPEKPFWVSIGKRNPTINDVKGLIQEQRGIPVNGQRLLFRGEELNNGGRTLKSYGIKYGSSTLRLVRLRGHGDDAVDISAVKARMKAVRKRSRSLISPYDTIVFESKSHRTSAESVANDCVRTLLESQLLEYKVKRLADENGGVMDETKRLMQELDMERSTGASFLKSEAGRRHIVTLKRQAAKSAVKEFKKSSDFKEIVMDRSMSVYDDVVKECQRLLRESGRGVSEDIVQLINAVDSDLEEGKADSTKLMQELEVERSTGSCFLQSDVGRRFMATLQRQAAKSGVEEFKESPRFKEILTNRSMSVYDDVVKECQRLLRESGRVFEDIVQLLDHPLDDDEVEEDDNEV